MKKFSLVTTSIFLIMTLLVGCGSTSTDSSTTASSTDSVDATTSAEQNATITPGKLVMATEATFPPYEYMDGTEVVGVDVDIANEIATAMGVELEVDAMDFTAVIEAVRSGKADFGVSGISITEERKQYVDFSIEYATSDQVILTRADSGVTSIEDLDGKTVAVQKGTTAHIVLPEDYPNITVEPYNRYTDAVMELNNGRVDAIVLDSLPAEALKSSNEGLVICDGVLFTDSYAIAVKKGNTELLNQINEVLEQLIAEGKIDEFTTAHLGE